MPSTLICLKVFIASPGGLNEERKAFREQIEEFNQSDAKARGVYFEPVGWEDALGGVGRPQALINEDVRQADYFMMMLWDRWGSPPDVEPSKYKSGTEEEYNVALECHAAKTMRQIVIAFKGVDPRQLSDPGAQLQQVLDFKKDLEKSKMHLFKTFDTVEEFCKLLRKHLAEWLRNQEKISAGDAITEPLLVESALKMDPDNNDLPRTSNVGLTIETAWKLANEGRLTEAEVEFSKSTVGNQNPIALIEYGSFLKRLGRLEQAEVMLKSALEIAKERQDETAIAEVYRGLGKLLYIQEDLAGAEQIHRKALEINERLGNLEGMAACYGNLGNVLYGQDDLEGAEQMYRNALKIHEQLGHDKGMATGYDNLGTVLSTQGHLKDGEQMHRKALSINERLGDLEGMAMSYNNLGYIFQTRGDLNGAEQMHRNAFVIAERIGAIRMVARTRENLTHLNEQKSKLKP
jgi:tetratricopeptide (TPR) repeat protein